MDSKFSVRYVDAAHNNRAGQILKEHYQYDHVIAMDGFYVQIDP